VEDDSARGGGVVVGGEGLKDVGLLEGGCGSAVGSAGLVCLGEEGREMGVGGVWEARSTSSLRGIWREKISIV